MSFVLFLIAQAAQAPAADGSATAEPVTVASPEFAVGKATLAEVLAKRGKPQVDQAMSDGTRTVVFIQTKMKAKGSSFIPVVGMFAAGAKSSVRVDSFTFGANGLLQSFTTTDSSANCSASIVGASCK